LGDSAGHIVGLDCGPEVVDVDAREDWGRTVCCREVTELSDRTIAALRVTHDELTSVVTGLSDEQLSAPSGASQWTVARVLSHLGSGAEIALATVGAAIAGTAVPGPDANQAVWDRWNALSERDQLDGYLASDERFLVALESLSDKQRQDLRLDLGFLPEPAPLALYLGMRLNEAALHGWDVRVSLDHNATLLAATAGLLAEHFASDLDFLLQFTGKPEALADPAVIDIQATGFTLVIADTAGLTRTAPRDPTAAFTGPLESVIRLLAGRLGAPYTPDGVDVTGNVTLDDLRRVFPGY
jgi:uncharacterized protein (TIGR03083 family)